MVLGVLIGAGLIVYGVVVPVIPEPPMLPDEEPTRPTTSASQAITPATPSSASSGSPDKEVIQSPRGEPEEIRIISQSGKVLISAKIRPVYIRPDRSLAPPSGVAGWLADEGWPKPGVLSRYNSIVAGHVSWNHQPDVFYRLPQVRKGDQAVIDYDSGDRVVVVITLDPVNIGKSVITSDPKYDWVWENSAGDEGRLVSFFTCNLEAQHINGSSVENWATQGEVVQVVRQ